MKLVNVPMKKVIGEWVIDVDFNKLELAVLRCLLYKASPLTGPEIKFIRTFLDMSTTEFGKVFGITHVAIIKWEKKKTGIPPSADIYIRLYVLNNLRAKDKEFRGLYNSISPATLIKHKKERNPVITLDVYQLKIA